jgi:hypothetical protein
MVQMNGMKINKLKDFQLQLNTVKQKVYNTCK